MAQRLSASRTINKAVRIPCAVSKIVQMILKLAKTIFTDNTEGRVAGVYDIDAVWKRICAVLLRLRLIGRSIILLLRHRLRGGRAGICRRTVGYRLGIGRGLIVRYIGCIICICFHNGVFALKSCSAFGAEFAAFVKFFSAVGAYYHNNVIPFRQ